MQIMTFVERLRTSKRHREFSKLDGLANLTRLKNEGKLPYLEIERYERITKWEIMDLALDPDRSYPMLIRNDAKKRETSEVLWSCLPRKKFPPFGDNRVELHRIAKALMDEMDNFLNWWHGIELVPFMHRLHPLPYENIGRIIMNHGQKEYKITIDRWIPENENGNHIFREHHEGSAYLEVLESGVKSRLRRVEPATQAIALKLRKTAKALLEDRKDGHTELSFVKYDGVELPVAYDWLRWD